jgi:hypothetical protein
MLKVMELLKPLAARDRGRVRLAIEYDKGRHLNKGTIL